MQKYINELNSNNDTKKSKKTEEEEEDDARHAERYKANRRECVVAEKFDKHMDVDVVPKSDHERKKIHDAMLNMILFSHLHENQLNKVIDVMTKRKTKTGDIIIKEGDDGDDFYVINKGTYRATSTAKLTDEKPFTFEYKGKGAFGELALMYNTPRAATIECLADGSLWCLTRVHFRHILAHSLEKQRKKHIKLVKNCHMLKELTDAESTNVADALKSRNYENGVVIFKQGDTSAREMYFIEKGSVKITFVENKTVVLTKNLEEGDFFGEVALMNHTARAATAETSAKSTLAVLDVESFERLLGPCTGIMKRNAKEYKKQLKDGIKHAT